MIRRPRQLALFSKFTLHINSIEFHKFCFEIGRSESGISCADANDIHFWLMLITLNSRFANF